MLQEFIKKNISLVFLAFLLFSGCSIGDRAPFTSQQPDKNDLIGTWRPTPATTRDMQERGSYDTKNTETKIVLQADGKVELQNMPDWWLDGFGESRRSFRTHNGTWKLTQTDSYWAINLSLNDVGTTISLKENAPPYKLHRYVGDPDSVNEMIFLRQEN